MTDPELPGFSYLVSREGVPAEGIEIVLSAPDAAKEQLRGRFDLDRLSELEATMVVSPWKKTGLKVEGRLKADLAQKCVITLAPVSSQIDEEFVLLFRPENSGMAKEQEVMVDVLADEPPDILEPEGVDLGEAVAEQLALLLDPYPKAPDAAFEAESGSDSGGESEEQDKPNPFSVLKNLKSDKDDPH